LCRPIGFAAPNPSATGSFRVKLKKVIPEGKQRERKIAPMKKALAFLFVLSMAFLCAACGNSTSKDSDFVIGEGVLTEYTGNANTVIIPDGVTEIAEQVFRDDTRMKSVVIPSSVETIGYWAFHACTKLTSVTLPDNGLIIGKGAFDYCLELQQIDIPDSAIVYPHAFSRCDKLTDTHMPGTEDIQIGKNAYTVCNVQVVNGSLTVKFIYFPFRTTSKITLEVAVGDDGELHVVDIPSTADYSVQVRLEDGAELPASESAAAFDSAFNTLITSTFDTDQKPAAILVTTDAGTVELDGLTWQPVE